MTRILAPALFRVGRRRADLTECTPRKQSCSIIRRLLLLRVLAVFVLGTASPTTVLADWDEYNCRSAINRFLTHFRSGNKTELANLIHFPLRRSYPIPPIERDEFSVRYHEVFDEELSKTIMAADPTEWQAVGWRGIMLHNGLLWLYYDGSVRAVNYSSAFEVAEKERLLKLRDELREQEREELHYSLREYALPVLEWETDTYRVRVDRIREDEYRYAAWKADVSHNTLPDIVLYEGVEQVYTNACCGSCGGAHTTYSFTNGEYLYEVEVNECACDPDEERFNLRVWRSTGLTAVIPETGCLHDSNEYRRIYNYDLLWNETFVDTHNEIDMALFDDYRSQNY